MEVNADEPPDMVESGDEDEIERGLFGFDTDSENEQAPEASPAAAPAAAPTAPPTTPAAPSTNWSNKTPRARSPG